MKESLMSERQEEKEEKVTTRLLQVDFLSGLYDFFV